ncbi:DMT family transporter [Sphingobium cloacae]|uniref:Permease n=1 Tax=Sphingobium cloacae TaxID=120107 RepID=A0A1E1EZI8_9SPHN|nr:DMT family transporter [Sphingobium cloacae]BAV63688.1 permease [Sphingobium cloacae]
MKDKAATGQIRLGAGALMLALLVNVMFALNVIAIKVVVDATAPLLAVSLRMGVVFLLCGFALRPTPGKVKSLALYGILNGGLFLLLMNVAMAMATNVGALAIAGQLSVPFSLLLGALLLGEKLSLRKLAGVLLAFAGVAALVFDPHIWREVPAVLVMALAALVWGGGTLVQRRLTGVSVMNGQAWNGLMGAVTLAPFALMFERPAIAGLAHVGAAPIGWFVFSCVGATVIGQGALAWLLQRYPISSIMPLILASPVMSTIFASLYFSTPITPIMIAGGTLALIGVAIIALSPDRKLAP